MTSPMRGRERFAVLEVCPVSWIVKPAEKRCPGWWWSWTKRGGWRPAVQQHSIQSKLYLDSIQILIETTLRQTNT